MSQDPEQAARREFAEELGPAASIGPLRALGEIRQRGGKRVIAFCGEADFETASLVSNSFEIEWPCASGHIVAFPEVDRAEWFDLDTARSKILSGQTELLDRLEKGCHGSRCIGFAIGMPWRIAESIRHQAGAAGSDASDSIRALCLSSVQNSDGIFAWSEL